MPDATDLPDACVTVTPTCGARGLEMGTYGPQVTVTGTFTKTRAVKSAVLPRVIVSAACALVGARNPRGRRSTAMSKKPRIQEYHAPAGGWGAALATGAVLREQGVIAEVCRRALFL